MSFMPDYDVAEFQTRILRRIHPGKAGLLEHDRMQANILCLHEEVLELTEAYDNADLAGAVDALVDLIYFAYGFLWQMGIPTRDVWDAVHEANMTKQLGNKGRGILDDAVKPEGWVDPKTVIRELLK